MDDEKPVQTRWGSWNRTNTKRLKALLKDRDLEEVVIFDGAEVLVSFGNYLVEYVEGQFAARNHGGL